MKKPEEMTMDEWRAVFEEELAVCLEQETAVCGESPESLSEQLVETIFEVSDDLVARILDNCDDIECPDRDSTARSGLAYGMELGYRVGKRVARGEPVQVLHEEG